MKCFVVLGMHRSATSLVAGGIDRYVNMGEALLGKSPHNKQGHFENMDFLNLNRQILSAAGGNWKNPPTEDRIAAQAGRFADKIQQAIIDNKDELWGWKDPRTTLTVKLYEPYLENVHYVACFRDPQKVAKSLEKRDGMPVEKGIELAQIYNKRLINFLA